MILSSRSTKPFRDWLDVKEDQGKFTWTLCMYGTDGCAKEANMSIEEYWEQINRACFLYEHDPVAGALHRSGSLSDLPTAGRFPQDAPAIPYTMSSGGISV